MYRGWNVFRLLIVVSWIASLLLINPPRAYACSCVVANSASIELRNSTVVFAGKVTDSEPYSAIFNGYPQMHVTFTVSEVWKGPVENTIIVETGMGGGDCGAGFEVGEEYLVYAYGTGPYYTSMCTRTASLSAATEDLEELGEGDIPDPAPPPSGFNVMFLIIPICAVVMLVMFAAIFVLYRRLSQKTMPD